MSQGMRPDRLHGIDMEQPARRVHDCGSFGDRLNDAGLVIGEHQRNQRRGDFATACGQRREIEPAIRVDRQSPRSRRAETGRRPAPRRVRSPRAKAAARGRFSSQSSIAGVSASILASVPLEVKNTSPGRAPTSAATCSRARSITRRAARPSACTEDGLPGAPKRIGKRRLRLLAQRRGGVPVEIAALWHSVPPVRWFGSAVFKVPTLSVLPVPGARSRRDACFLSPGLC